MQPYTPHGDSNRDTPHSGGVNKMQPYTPHGDSNYLLRWLPVRRCLRMQPYTPHGDSNCYCVVQPQQVAGMQPYTPHGDSNVDADSLKA